MMLTNVSPDKLFSYFEMEIAELKKEIINSKVKIAEAVIANELGSSSIIDNGQYEVYYMERVIEYRIENKLK